ncbi:hypothetical protein EXIGLDRAFT_720466 [Exidia glandulosa HHB12029]|uniref:Uncharacterized protein n=1 Tax=Exidia glandulosa HHB12029 TaxID=1314781 RepID=A0A165NK45_EXIGL|nr:hypothetical protein EXIGLDRAFT_720466 [Exidia glandulosa HHB12029]
MPVTLPLPRALALFIANHLQFSADLLPELVVDVGAGITRRRRDRQRCSGRFEKLCFEAHSTVLGDRRAIQDIAGSVSGGGMNSFPQQSLYWHQRSSFSSRESNLYAPSYQVSSFSRSCYRWSTKI